MCRLFCEFLKVVRLHLLRLLSLQGWPLGELQQRCRARRVGRPWGPILVGCFAAGVRGPALGLRAFDTSQACLGATIIGDDRLDGLHSLCQQAV
jgi:hypothetical protein